ncbi:MAG TPA: demethoxyubiquinone hydroxylase family protein [Gammaproteobacteria bacterium]|nr:demethoxyubiquinone hydroxylase family protein [Gammaproteobacteria bacterium]|tara:strand:+ start:2714 stop:3346 length:633 start_codon:yes stop_codon:yes gene_type:complete
MALSALDKVICDIDRALRISSGSLGTGKRQSPAPGEGSALKEADCQIASRLMRVNHTGEVCAQALYQGQAMTTRNQNIRKIMQQSADEETDHLVWCEQRIKELGSHTSYLNPFFYLGSLSIGALAGTLGDKVNLGFVAATEDGVVTHLKDHLKRLPSSDAKSRAILEKMKDDESRHADKAMQSGGYNYPPMLRRIMRGAAQVMTKTTYWF